MRASEPLVGEKNIAVAIIEPVGGHSGMNYYDFGLASGIAANGWGVALYTCDETSAPSEPPNFIFRPYFRKIYGTDPIWLRGFRFVRDTILVASDARKRGAKIAHFHFFYVSYIELSSILIARLFGLRIVITAHDVESLAEGVGNNYLSKLVYRRADKIIAHSKVAKRELQQSLGIAQNKIDYVPIGNYIHVMDVYMTQEQARQLLSLPQNAKILLFLGQIKQAKGLDLLIRAFASVVESEPDTYLVIAGRVWKDSFDSYAKLILELGIGHRCITHISFVPDNLMAAYHFAADLIILPYTRVYQSASLYMAMAYKVPILASDIEGMTELISDGVNGYLFRSEDWTNLASCIIAILQAPVGNEALVERAFETMRTDYSWTKIGKLTIDCYKQAMSRKTY